MAHHPHAFLPGASKRLEALSDGVFAIACTLLVLEIHILHFKKVLVISKKRVYKQIVSSPFLYVAAIAGGLISTYIPITIYIIMPIIFMFMPQLDFDTKEEELKKEHTE